MSCVLLDVFAVVVAGPSYARSPNVNPSKHWAGPCNSESIVCRNTIFCTAAIQHITGSWTEEPASLALRQLNNKNVT